MGVQYFERRLEVCAGRVLRRASMASRVNRKFSQGNERGANRPLCGSSALTGLGAIARSGGRFLSRNKPPVSPASVDACGFADFVADGGDLRAFAEAEGQSEEAEGDESQQRYQAAWHLRGRVGGLRGFFEARHGLSWRRWLLAPKYRRPAPVETRITKGRGR